MVDLQWQYDWRGTAIANLRILVCKPCRDTPQEQLRAILLPADPTPIINARVQDFEAASSDYRTITGGTVDPVTGIFRPNKTLRVTEDCQNRVTEVIGSPDGLTQNAVMPYNGGVMKAFGTELDILSVSANGTTTIQVTCRRPHNLHTNDQVSAEGLTARYANGFYSVNVITATAFTYETYQPIKQNALLTPTTRIVTALVGLPRGFITIPKIKGPPVPQQTTFCYLATESGNIFLLENGAGFITLEQCPQMAEQCYFALENDTGTLLLENGSSIALEQCPDQVLCFLETEAGDILLLENGGYITLEQCGSTPVCYFETEDGAGMILLESGDALTLEQCQDMALYNFQLENSSGDVLLENGTDFLQQEAAP